MTLDDIIKEWRTEKRQPHWSDTYLVGRSDARELCAKDIEAYATREREARTEAWRLEERLGAYLNTMVADLKIEGQGEYLRTLFGRFLAEERSAEREWLKKLEGLRELSEKAREAIQLGIELTDLEDRDKNFIVACVNLVRSALLAEQDSGTTNLAGKERDRVNNT